MQGPNVLERRGGKTLETSLIAGSSYGRAVADNFSASTHARKKFDRPKKIDADRQFGQVEIPLRDLTTLLYFSFRPTGSCERQKDEESSFVASAKQVDSRNRNLTEKGFKILTLYT